MMNADKVLRLERKDELQNKMTNIQITSWTQFTEIVRSKGCRLLKRLDDFPNAILVTGCQRSGTTMLSRIITQSNGMTNYWFGKDDELDAALILSGYVDHKPNGRYCFQTTYLNECYKEYYEHTGSFKIIWVIRNPYSVVYSLLYNWGPPDYLERNFRWCAANQLQSFDRVLYNIFGSKWVKPLRQASLFYNAKTIQLMELIEKIGEDRLFVVDYDDLVQARGELLRKIYQFVSLGYSPEYSEKIHNKSLGKKGMLSDRELHIIKDLCEPIYKEAQKMKSVSLPERK